MERSLGPCANGTASYHAYATRNPVRAVAAKMQQFIETSLHNAFPGANIRVTDTTGGGDHFDVDISAPQFVGIGMIEQHRAVYAALGERVGYEIHALALKTRPLVP